MTRRFVVYGAGGIGGTLGARLQLAGERVTLIARGAHLAAILADGLRFVAPGGEQRLAVHACADPAAADLTDDDIVVLAMKSQHTQVALDALARVAPPEISVVCMQNGVANERLALRYFPRVYATIVHLPALHLEAGEVVTFAEQPGGVLDTGRFPAGVDDTAVHIAAVFQSAGFNAIADPAVMRKKYAKLLANLVNALQAATEMADGAAGLAGDLRREAAAVYAAAGIDCASKAEMRALGGRYAMTRVPGFEHLGGSSWQSVARGTGNIETDYLNGEICLLGRLHGVATPINDTLVTVARELVRDRRPPGSFTPQEIRDRIGAVR